MSNLFGYPLCAVAFFLLGWWMKKTYGDTKSAEKAAEIAVSDVAVQVKKTASKL